MRPDRIIMGEVRDGEAFDLLQALNTGHQGTLSTIHANSAAETLTRFATCVMMAGIELPHRTVRANIGDALPLIVHLKRPHGRRSVTEVLRVDGYDRSTDEYRLKVLYQK
jgi:pilus assembly protein CpaF